MITLKSYTTKHKHIIKIYVIITKKSRLQSNTRKKLIFLQFMRLLLNQIYRLRSLLSLFATICGVLEGSGRLFEDWILASVPLSHHSLLFKLRKLSSIVNSSQ